MHSSLLTLAMLSGAAATTKCPVTCKQVQISDTTRVSHEPHSPNYANSLVHNSVADDDWRIKVTHNVYDVNTGAYMHHRCFKTTDETVNQADRCRCECLTLTSTNPTKNAITKFPKYSQDIIVPYNPYGDHDDVKTGNANNNKALSAFWSDRTSDEAEAANTNN